MTLQTQSEPDYHSTLRSALAAFFVLLVGVFITYGILAWRAEKQAMLTACVQQNSFVSAGSEDFLAGVGYGIDAIARTARQTRTTDHADAMWATLHSSHPEIESLLLTDKEGVIRFSSSKDRGGRDSRELRQLFEQDALAGRRFNVGVPRNVTNPDAAEISISHLSHDNTGTPLWRVESTVRLRRLVARWQTELMPPQATVVLIKDKGTVIAKAGHTDTVQSNAVIGTVLRAIRNSEHIEDTFEFNSLAVIGSFQRLQRHDMYTLIILPTSAVWQRWLDNNAVPFFIFMIGIAIYCYLSLLLFKREKAHAERLLQLANTDILTSVPNRAAAQRHLSKMIEKSKRNKSHFGVIFIDLDEFKFVNDTYGHHCGDQVLITLTSRLSTLLRAGDALFRLGGDEYLAIVECSDGCALNAVCERLLGATDEPVPIKTVKHTMSLSIGAAFFPVDGDNAEDLLKNADIAMYAVKHAGRNGFQLFDTAMADDVGSKTLLKDDLSRALDRQEFTLHYQPRFDHVGALCGVEALIRWQHPVKGLLMPDSFIGQAEKCGLIIPIGKWVMRTACQQIIAWQNKFGMSPVVSVNASIKELESAHFADATLRIIAEAGVSPQQISIEVTESMLMTDPVTVTQHLDTLTKAGLSIELDDFGTGFSSLSQLYRLPIKTIKIDRSFVNLIESSKESRSIIIAIIALANALECEIIAEGVETLEQLNFLKACNCRNYQGYYFARPELPGSVERFVARQSAHDMIASESPIIPIEATR